MTLILVFTIFYFIYLKYRSEEDEGSGGFFNDHLGNKDDF